LEYESRLCAQTYHIIKETYKRNNSSKSQNKRKFIVKIYKNKTYYQKAEKKDNPGTIGYSFSIFSILFRIV